VIERDIEIEIERYGQTKRVTKTERRIETQTENERE
jgi:hypothetical protein